MVVYEACFWDPPDLNRLKVGELQGLTWSASDYSRYIMEITPNMVGGKAKVTSTVAYHVMYWTLLPFLEFET